MRAIVLCEFGPPGRLALTIGQTSRCTTPRRPTPRSESRATIGETLLVA